MSRIEELKASVEKAKEKVEKCTATIGKHGLALIKKQDVLRKMGIEETANWADITFEERSAISEVNTKRDDIKGATKKLKEAMEVLAGWQAKLDVAVEKERFINDQAPQVIRDFLQNWKERAFEWHVKRYENYLKFRDKLAKEELDARIKFVEDNAGNDHLKDEKGKVRKDKRDWNTLHNYVHDGRREMEKHLKELHLDYSSIRQRENSYAGAVVLRMKDYRDETERLAYLEKELEREKQNKMVDLIQRVNAVVGSMTDAGGLRIDVKGNLNGIVVGEKGKAKVETIGAGGWNIQCWHYRTLVHAIKEKVKA